MPGASYVYGSLCQGGSGRSARASAHAAAALMELLLDSRFACRGRGNGAASTLGLTFRLLDDDDGDDESSGDDGICGDRAEPGSAA